MATTPFSVCKEFCAGAGGTGSNIIVDTELNENSTNPISNKAVTTKINGVESQAIVNEQSISDIMDGKVSIPAHYDANGNVIHTTYATKEELANVGGGNSNITIDTDVDTFSSNPIANFAITRYADSLNAKIISGEEMVGRAQCDAEGNDIAETYATKENLEQEKFIRCNYENIDNIITAGKYIVSVPDEKLPFRGDAFLFVSNVIANNKQFHQILIGADGTITKRSGNISVSLDGVTKTIWSEWQTYATKEALKDGSFVVGEAEVAQRAYNDINGNLIEVNKLATKEDLKSIGSGGNGTGSHISSELIEKLENLPNIKYVQSDDFDNPMDLIELDSGIYVLDGFFKHYKGASAIEYSGALAMVGKDSDTTSYITIVSHDSAQKIEIDNTGGALKFYQTATDVNNRIDSKIGDIETSLENIITKYGLGGETV